MGSSPDAGLAPMPDPGLMTNTTGTINQTDPKIAAIERLYAAYGRGDVDAVLAELADDIDWAAEAAGSGVPWWGTFRGKADVPRFFAYIDEVVSRRPELAELGQLIAELQAGARA